MNKKRTCDYFNGQHFVGIQINSVGRIVFSHFAFAYFINICSSYYTFYCSLLDSYSAHMKLSFQKGRCAYCGLYTQK